ncbi:hypothetical protein FCV25MIE_15558, partial [Fagus crenata]
MTKQTGERVAFGKVEEVDVLENEVGWGPFLCVRITLDITKPIPRGCLVTFSSIGQMWVSFKYERLPWLCFSCGIIGHLERDSTSKLSRSSSSLEVTKQYGSWLWASDVGPRRNAVGGGRSISQQSLSVPPRGVRRGKFSKFENNRHADFVGSSSRSAREKIAQNLEPILPTHPGLSPMCVDKDCGVGVKLVVGEKAVTGNPMKAQSLNLEQQSSVMIVTRDKDELVSDVVGAKQLDGLSAIPVSTQQPANSATEDSVIPAKVKLHGAVDVGSSNHPSHAELPRGDDMHQVAREASSAIPNKGTKNGKKFWKRLA